MSILTSCLRGIGTSYNSIASVTTRREVISASYKPLGNIFSKNISTTSSDSTISPEMKEKLILYRLRKKRKCNFI